MGATYTPGNVGQEGRDRVRFLVGDTNAADPLLDDAELDALLAREKTSLRAAIAACDALAARFTGDVNYGMGGLNVSAGDRSAKWATRAEQLRADLLAGGVGVYAGGVSVAEADAATLDSGKRQPSFRRGQDDLVSYANVGADQLLGRR